jgi:hypothetical protein
MNFESLLSSPVHPAIAEAARYFQTLAPGDTLPKRRDFRPTRVPALLGYYFLVNVRDDSKDYYFRLIGEHMALLFGSDVTHKWLSEIGNAPLCVRLRETYDLVVAKRTFYYVRGRYTWPERSVAIERLLVPMTDDNGKLDTILGVSITDTKLDSLNLLAGIGAANLEIDSAIIG